MAATRYVYPKDRCLSILDLEKDVSTTAFGVENLEELLADLKPEKPPRIAQTHPVVLAGWLPATGDSEQVIVIAVGRPTPANSVDQITPELGNHRGLVGRTLF